MKNECYYSPCQYRSSTSYSGKGPISTPTPEAMGHKAPSSPSQLAGLGGGAHFRGLLEPLPQELRCNCTCVELPEQHTILHSILTGRGYKFGYGTVFGDPPFFTGPSHGFSDTTDFFLNLPPLDSPSKVHSPEVTSHSRYISQPPAK